MRKEIDVLDYASEILKGVKEGVLITTTDGKKANPMTISWGSLGIMWGMPVFTAYIRTARYSYGNLEKTGEFTVNIPVGEYDKNIISICGAKSGRDVDKIKECHLTPMEAEEVSAPALKEMKMTLECRVLYKQEPDKEAIPEEIKGKFYRPDAPKGNDTFHTMFIAQVVKAYIEE